MKDTIARITDALALVVEAQRDAMAGNADAAMRQAAGAIGLLNEAVSLNGK